MAALKNEYGASYVGFTIYRMICSLIHCDLVFNLMYGIVGLVLGRVHLEILLRSAVLH